MEYKKDTDDFYGSYLWWWSVSAHLLGFIGVLIVSYTFHYKCKLSDSPQHSLHIHHDWLLTENFTAVCFPGCLCVLQLVTHSYQLCSSTWLLFDASRVHVMLQFSYLLFCMSHFWDVLSLRGCCQVSLVKEIWSQWDFPLNKGNNNNNAIWKVLSEQLEVRVLRRVMS